MRTTWTGVPDELRSTASQLLDRHERLVPGWVKLLAVRYNSELVDCYADVSVEQSQNRAVLTFAGGFLDCDEQEREWVVVHEIMHMRLSPLEKAWDAMMDALPKKMRAVADKLFEEAIEEAVSGLAYALVKEDA